MTLRVRKSLVNYIQIKVSDFYQKTQRLLSVRLLTENLYLKVCIMEGTCKDPQISCQAYLDPSTQVRSIYLVIVLLVPGLFTIKF